MAIRVRDRSIRANNILDVAMNAIGYDYVDWYPYAKRELNEYGEWVTTHCEPKRIKGHIQPLSADDVKELGLDTSKSYYKFYSSHPLVNVKEGRSVDKVVFCGTECDVLHPKDWYHFNGWRKVVLVERAV